MNTYSSHHLIEEKFHDQWAQDQDGIPRQVDQAFEAITAPENRQIIGSMGEIKNKRILDIGCGLGEASLYFARRGAVVVAADISAGMVNALVQIAMNEQLKITGHTGPFEMIDLRDEAFDIIYAANVLHHVKDKADFLKNINKFLKPGGKVYMWDPLTYNPLIWAYRLLARSVRTPTEKPLDRNDLHLINKTFSNAKFTFHWFLSTAIFLKYFLFNFINPSKNRYWKLVLDEKESDLWWWKPLFHMDRLVITKIPCLRLLCWTVVVEAEKSSVDHLG